MGDFMRLGYTILHVNDVVKTIEFYEKAFGLKRKLIHSNLHYGELETGETILAFASHELMAMNIKGYDRSINPHGFEIAFVVNNIQQTYEKAIKAGATPVKTPQKTEWGQTIAYVRDLNNALVELATPYDISREN
ncbi:MAG: hypothetical protein K0S74_1121 [Chlamydiales bacterium]|jgi:uncharacterized glyoxalase superfamily protein PhnB|nr:hypothetical protein [Chlamydiales bacterium]